MSAQPVTPELRQWIVAQAATGQSPDALVKAMRASGWSEDAARRALQATLNMTLPDAAVEKPAAGGTPVPEPVFESGRMVLDAGDRTVHVVHPVTGNDRFAQSALVEQMPLMSVAVAARPSGWNVPRPTVYQAVPEPVVQSLSCSVRVTEPYTGAVAGPSAPS